MKTKSKLIKPYTKKSFITYALLIAVFTIVQLILNFGKMSFMMQSLLVPLCVYSILAVSLNLTVGILGELSLGQAGFMCIGAYSGALFSSLMKEAIPEAMVRFPIAILLGGLCAALFGVLIGIPVLRLRGDYLAIVTLAFGEIIKNICASLYLGKDAEGFHLSIKSAADMNMAPDGKMIINGALGLNGTPKDSNFTVAFIILLITVIIAYNFVYSRTGRAVMSIRDNRIAAESVGLNITKYKLITFGLTAFLAGVAGVIYSHNFSTLQASKFDYNMSILILVFVVLGGIGSIRGSVIAAVVLTLIPELLRETIGNYRMLFYAVILIAMMLVTSNSKLKGRITAYTNKLKGLIKKEKKGEIK
ncbi:MAG: branched-chain amino acid ABC transporter permease [Clostridia bacterium]|nr:branched-chain amino acid ABC transporter permease [Clostridia bacterium]